MIILILILRDPYFLLWSDVVVLSSWTAPMAYNTHTVTCFACFFSSGLTNDALLGRELCRQVLFVCVPLGDWCTWFSPPRPRGWRPGGADCDATCGRGIVDSVKGEVDAAASAVGVDDVLPICCYCCPGTAALLHCHNTHYYGFFCNGDWVRGTAVGNESDEWGQGATRACRMTKWINQLIVPMCSSYDVSSGGWHPLQLLWAYRVFWEKILREYWVFWGNNVVYCEQTEYFQKKQYHCENIEYFEVPILSYALYCNSRYWVKYWLWRTVQYIVVSYARQLVSTDKHSLQYDS